MAQAYPIEITSSHFEVLASIEGFVRENIPTLLKSVEESWQPSDFVPDLSVDGWEDEVRSFQEVAKTIPDDLLVVLVGDMVTEEALPSYQTWLNNLAGLQDDSGTGQNAWALWSRGWTSEENRHGDLLNRYLYLSGRVNMHSVEKTIHHLIANGFNPGTENNPYHGFIYTSFQERATKISHRNVAKLAAKVGEERLQKICGLIAGDEARHEKAYKLFMTKIFEVDPNDAMRAVGNMLKMKIAMPAVLMNDGEDPDLFTKFSMIAQKTGVYTATDYAEIIDDLVETWGLDKLTGLSSSAAKAQEYACTLAARYKKLAERVIVSGTHKFSWINGREV